MWPRPKPSQSITSSFSSHSQKKLIKSDNHHPHQQPVALIEPQTVLRKLESCGSLRHFNQVHTQLIITSLFQDSLFASRVVKKLCTHLNSVNYAVSFFHRLEEPDAFICNTIIRCFVNLCDDPSGGLRFYVGEMAGNSIVPNHYTFPILAKACALIGSLGCGGMIHGRVVRCGFENDLFVRNSLIHMYFVCGRVRDARKVFDSGPDLDLVTLNSMIDGYVKNGDIDAAFDIFDAMGDDGDVFSWNSMIAGYVAVGDMEKAIELFERMPSRDVVSWNCVIDGYAKIGNVLAARELFDRMPFRNVVSWNTMLALYVRAKKHGKCMELFDTMIKGGETNPNESTLVSVLTACASLGKFETGHWVNSYLKTSCIKPDVLLSTALLTMYAKCGDMDLARNVFDSMPERNIVSWNAIIMGYGMHGRGEKSLEMFLEMVKTGQRPNDATFVCIFSACTHGGMILEGWWYFDLMCRVYKIEPKVEHYGCIIDLLGRAGLMNDSEELLRKMMYVEESATALWGALLSACETHSNLELGEVVAKRLIELDPRDEGPYVLLSNIYATGGKWSKVDEVRKTMKKKGIQKVTGVSLLHSGESGHQVCMDNSSVHRKNMILSMLGEMGSHMKLPSKDIIE